MTTTPTHCNYCGTAFSIANPATSKGECQNAWACVQRHWDAMTPAEKEKLPPTTEF